MEAATKATYDILPEKMKSSVQGVYAFINWHQEKNAKKTSFCQIPKTNLFDLMKLIGHIHAGHTKNMDINKFFKLTAFMKVKIDYDKS